MRRGLIFLFILSLLACGTKKEKDVSTALLNKHYLAFKDKLEKSGVKSVESEVFQEITNEIDNAKDDEELRVIMQKRSQYFKDDSERKYVEDESLSLAERKILMKYIFYLNFQDTYIYYSPTYQITNWNAVPISTKEGTITYQIHSKNYYSVEKFPMVVTNSGDTISLKDIEGTPYFEFEAPESDGGFEIHVAYPFGIYIHPLVIGVPKPYTKREL